MTRSRRYPLVALALVACLCIAGSSAARTGEVPRAEPTVGRMVFDAAVLRPLSFVQTVVSLVFFLPAYPISLVTGGSDHVIEYCVTDPVERTFQRPLGEL